MEHYFLRTTAAVVGTAAAVIAAPQKDLSGYFIDGAEAEIVELAPDQKSSTPLPCPALNLPLAINDAEVKAYIESGMLDLLLGWEEHARVQFTHAISKGAATENTSLMAYCGMMLAVDKMGEKDANRLILLENLEKIPGTPVEIFYLNTFIKLIGGDVKGAAADFEERANRYKRDTFSALWACMLYHCSEIGYDVLGEPNSAQAKALQMASALYAQYPEDALVCYVRAYIEEGAPKVSQEALEAAHKAVEGLAGHPMPHLLYGHLLYRSERVEEAILHLHKAVELSENSEIKPEHQRLQMIARLYESTALWSARKTKEALAMRRAMNAQPLNRQALDEAAVVLQRWETATLPLRILVLRVTPPDVSDIRAAAAAATPKPALEGEDAVLHVRDCLRAALYARARVKQNDMDSAQKSLKLAKEAFEKFEATQEDVFKRGSHYITPWYRAQEACKIAMLVANSDVFPDPDEFWKKVAESVKQPVNLLMPPPLPIQFGPEPPAQLTPKAPAKNQNQSRRSRRKK